MPYKVSWLIENRVILAQHYGVFTGEELLAYLDESLAMRDRANEISGVGGPLIHTLTDARKLEKSAMALRDVQPILRSLRKQRTGWSIYVHPGKVDRFLASLGHQFVGVRYRAFEKMSEAIAFLEEMEPSLRGLPELEGLKQDQPIEV